MATINRQSIYARFEKSAASGKLKKQLDAQLNTQFLAAKQELIASVIADPVSQEIAAGPGLESSQFLPVGNLFSFIGFDSSRKPVTQLVELLEKNVRAKPAQFSRQRGTAIQYFKQIQFPKIKDLEAADEAKYDEWAGSFGSWIRGVREGVAGYPHYLFDLTRDFGGASRSGPAIQIKGELPNRGTHEGRPEYLDSQLKEFETKIRNVQLEGSKLRIV